MRTKIECVLLWVNFIVWIYSKNKYIVFRKLLKVEVEMIASDFLKRNLRTLQKILSMIKLEKFKRMICLGIGPFSFNIDCLHQLAFFMILIKKFDIRDVEFYDPVLTEHEKIFLTSKNIKITPENYEGFYSIDSSTLVCLPHCPVELTNNILWQNWSPNSLSKIVLLCNSIDEVLAKNSETANENYKELKKISSCIKEFPLENNYCFRDIFNNMAFHLFDMQSEKLSSEGFWVKESKPLVSSAEMITNDLEKIKI
ncbi:SRR1-like protein isoform X2 [Condylostylus longicornis]|uniref:SRR1-like protein isoform X2 n=1 Tax=Condylostylus longicornis TaxID=2530218 RepID=UPI00244E33C4|nr:SRR1-like protein isoform X2 [Condylostylus longicornis]